MRRIFTPRKCWLWWWRLWWSRTLSPHCSWGPSYSPCQCIPGWWDSSSTSYRDSYLKRYACLLSLSLSRVHMCEVLEFVFMSFPAFIYHPCKELSIFLHFWYTCKYILNLKPWICNHCLKTYFIANKSLLVQVFKMLFLICCVVIMTSPLLVRTCIL